MTTNEMAQKGFNTGFTDADGNELHVGDYVRLCGDIGEIVFSCGAFGIFIVDEVPWDALEELVRKDSGNRPSFLYNDNFISFWEIVWNLSEDSDEPCLPHVKSVTATGGIFTDEEGNKDVFMGCISSCFATLTQCEHTCGRYYTCDTVAIALLAVVGGILVGTGVLARALILTGSRMYPLRPAKSPLQMASRSMARLTMEKTTLSRRLALSNSTELGN